MAEVVLSLFPGIGLLDTAFERAGFCVVRGPDLLWGGDVRGFHPPAGVFDGVVGGPPCQPFSRLAHMVRHNGLRPRFGDLTGEFERVVAEAAPRWFLMENVPGAPVPGVEGYGVYAFLLNNRQCVDEDGRPAAQHRVRRWSFGWRGGRRPLPVETTALESAGFVTTALGGDPGPRRGGMPSNVRSRRVLAELCRRQGLPEGFLAHSPFTVAAACRMVGNGVPLPMGLAVARAVREVLRGAGAGETPAPFFQPCKG